MDASTGPGVDRATPSRGGGHWWRDVQTEQIEQIVHQALPEARVSARDTTGTGDHWHVIVVDDAFEGLMPIKRQRLVMEPFKPLIASDQVHALDLVTVTPKEAAERGVEIPTSRANREESQNP